MSRIPGTFGIALAAALALGAFSCSSGGSKKSNGSGGSGGAGGLSSCGPTASGFNGSCAPGAPPECCAATIPVMQVRINNALVAPDWSCIGIGTPKDAGAGGSGGSAGTDAGAGGASGADAGTDAGGGSAGASADGGPPPNSNVFEVENFGADGLVADVDVDLFSGDGIVGKTPFFSGTTKGPSTPNAPAELNNGQLYFPHPSNPILAYHVKAKVGVAQNFYGFFEVVPPPPGKVSGATVSPSLYQQLATFAVPIPGWTPPTDLGIVTAPIRDCSDDDVGGALFKLIDGATGKEVQSGTCARDPRFIYFDGSTPNTKCQYSDYRQALSLVVNAPTNTDGANKGHVYKIQFFGRLRASDAQPVMFAEKSVEIFPNAVNVYEIKPNVMQK